MALYKRWLELTSQMQNPSQLHQAQMSATVKAEPKPKLVPDLLEEKDLVCFNEEEEIDPDDRLVLTGVNFKKYI